ncbi:RnfH family protein [Neisseria sp. CCUG12390]|uniref:RnfH family protein n=1 Tax=Neisseria sp. CCUG12390 TaxID=3392035 RepID=UPI003A102634
MLNIEIVYGLPDKQVLKTMQVAEGTTIRQAALQSGLENEFSDLDLNTAKLGIFGKAVKDDTVLREKDRIEIYRPLLIDPKEARRRRVQNQED